VLPQAIGPVLPAAVGVALSPIPIIGVILVLATPRARTSGPAFAFGWITGLTVVCIVVINITGSSSDPDSATATGVNWVKVGLGVIFLVMAARQWRARPKEGEPTELPKWLVAVDEITPAKAFGLGVALSAANPKNLALTLAAAASIAQVGTDAVDETIAVVIFVVLGSVTVAGAVLATFVAPKRSERLLESLRVFMMDHSAVIMMIVLLVLGAKLIGDGLGGFGR
jgi:threonine/homoserine/homoserine lactone efflux protein